MSRPLALIIGDNPALNLALSSLLEIYDINSEVPDIGTFTHAQLVTFKPELLILDFPLYRYIGISILIDTRCDLRLRHTKLIVLTTERCVGVSELRLADAILIKPFPIEVLESEVCRLTEIPVKGKAE
jgi:DNA-binding response OmpR family regulator